MIMDILHCIAKLFEQGFYNFTPDFNRDECWTVTAAGDTAIAREPGETFVKIGPPAFWQELKPLIQADISICNLEAGLYSNSVQPPGGVKGRLELMLQSHKAMPFSLYCLANNHIKDAGDEELKNTLAAFAAEGINYVGAGDNLACAMKPYYQHCCGIKAGFLAFAQDEGQIAGDAAPGAAPLAPETVLQQVERLVASSDVPMVLLHEGFEFMNWPRLEFKNFCHQLVNAGVKVIFAHHSHVPQGIEFVNDAVIFYSLGNFIFYTPRFSSFPWSKHSFVPRIYFKDKNIARLEIQPVVIKPEQGSITVPADPDESRQILAHLKRISLDLLDKNKLQKVADEFLTNILLKEYFSFIARYSANHDDDFAGLMKLIKTSEPHKKIFKDVTALYPPSL